MKTRLENIANVLDRVQNELNKLDKNSEIAHELYTVRCELEDLKEDLFDNLNL